MAIASVAIYPAIGIARVGDSPDEFFVGPERPGAKPDPQGGFKDGDCRVKRQGARFRLFATHDDGTIEELTDEDFDIEWTVHLANKKAATRKQPGTASELEINPGKASVSGTNQHTPVGSGNITFPTDSGSRSESVPLGDLRTDEDGRLIVLGGHGDSGSPTGESIQHFSDNPGWYDDVSDGPVTATVTTSSDKQISAEGAWVVVAPPKFAPELDHVITLYDRVADSSTIYTGGDPSYNDDIYPILERARQIRWVTGAGPDTHTWSHPVVKAGPRNAIFGRLKPPNGNANRRENMPPLYGEDGIGGENETLTEAQYEDMKKWSNANFEILDQKWSSGNVDIQNWSPPSPPANVTPDGMTEAALENTVGAAFFPGLEVGGLSDERVILDRDNFVDGQQYRPDHTKIGPGDLTKYMAVPWQADFYTCAGNVQQNEYWWPVHHPELVLPDGESRTKTWDRGVNDKSEMVSKWSDLGFVVEQDDGQYREVERCSIPHVSLLTPTVDFGAVPEGPMGSRKTAAAITFEVSAPNSQVELTAKPGQLKPSLTLVSSPAPVGPTGDDPETVRFWVQYETQSPPHSVGDRVTIERKNSNETWSAAITAKTVGRRTAATALVLDRSGSMSESAGPKQTKHENLEDAAKIFLDVALEDDAVGIVPYNEDVDETDIHEMEKLGSPGSSDPARNAVKGVITSDALEPEGQTSIGDGIFAGRALLNDSTPHESTDYDPSDYDEKSLVVLTDGKENEPRWLADVAGSIDEQTYAIGLGRPENTSAPALQDISANHRGYMLVTGDVDSSNSQTTDNEFILRKYFLQILTGVSDGNVVLDPEGTLTPGAEHRIPFQMTDVDTGLEVVLLTDEPSRVDFRIEAPSGNVVKPWRADADPAMRWVLSDGVAYFRLPLPVDLREDRFDRRGKWHAVLRLGSPQLEPDEGLEAEEFADLREQHGESWSDASSRSEDETPDDSELVTDLDASLEEAQPVEEGDVESSGGALPPKIVGRTDLPGSDPDRADETGADSLRYSLQVNTYSNLEMDARVQQTGYEPGDELCVVASLVESGIPLQGASVRAHVTRPNETSEQVRLETRDDGDEYRGTVETTVPGVYRIRVRARGETRSGVPFQREHVATGAVWNGGARDAEASRSGDPVGTERDRLACDLLRCLSGDALDPEALAEFGVDVGTLRECLRSYCERVARPETEGERAVEPYRPDDPIAQLDPELLQDILDSMTEEGPDS